MKKFAFLALIFITILTSCNTEGEDPTSFQLEVLPIESVIVPDHFVLGESYEISVTYLKPNPCYYFNDFIYEIDDHERTVAVVNTVYTDNSSSCDGLPEEVTVNFDFMATNPETYLFKFFQGADEQGVDQYHLVEVPVVE